MPQETSGEQPDTKTPRPVAVSAADLRRPVEQWADELKTPSWLFRAARQKFRWPIGQELTRAGYDAAIEATRQEVIA